MYDEKNYSLYQDAVPLPQPALVDDRDDDSKWEIDTAIIIDTFYHELLGETEQDGQWVRDMTLKRWMNEQGASWIKSLLKSRIDKITFLSRLNDEFMRDSLKNIGRNIADMLFRYYNNFEIEPSIANLETLSNMILEKIEITYKSAQDGGIREYRVRRKGGIIGQYPQMYQNPYQQGMMPQNGPYEPNNQRGVL